jgi:hypothetical protein
MVVTGTVPTGTSLIELNILTQNSAEITEYHINGSIIVGPATPP